MAATAAAAVLRNNKKHFAPVRDHAEVPEIQLINYGAPAIGTIAAALPVTPGLTEDYEEKPEAPTDVSGSANVILYVGLIMVALGLLVTFIGLGDQGFKSVELRLIGPSLVGCGVFFALLRILFCTVPPFLKTCCKCCRRKEDSEKLLDDENIGEDEIRANLKTAMTRNGLLQPIRRPVTKNRPSDKGIGYTGSQQPLFISDDEEEPREVKSASQDTKTLDTRFKQDRYGGEPLSYSFSSSFSLEELDLDIRPEFIQRHPHLGGTTSIKTNKF